MSYTELGFRPSFDSEPEEPGHNLLSQKDSKIDRTFRKLKSSLALQVAKLSLPILAVFSGFAGVAASSRGDFDSKHLDSDNIVGASRQIRRNTEPFLRYPFEVKRDPSDLMKVVQAWIYKGYRGNRTHGGVDYIKSTSLSDSSLWQPFDVLAPADGVACQQDFAIDSNGDSVVEQLYLVKIRHPNGWTTRYLHLDEKSLNSRSEKFPNCARPISEWLAIETAQKIATAGRSGTDYLHLHLDSYDSAGVPVDLYGLYRNRDYYPWPYPYNTPGKYCGAKALFVEEICPRGQQEMRVGDATIEPTIEPTPEPTPTEVIEKLSGNEGILDLGNWQLGIESWTEQDNRSIGAGGGQSNPGYKYVYVRGFVKNTSGRVLHSWEVDDCCRDSNVFYLTSGGFKYKSAINMLDHVAVPPGFSLPIEIETEVAANKNNFSLFRGLDVDNQINEGEVAKGFERISADAKIKNLSDDIISAQTQEIEMMQKWYQDWGY